MKDIAILTENRYLKPNAADWYVKNILKEDSLVQLELEQLGLTCARVAWDNDFNPADFKFALFRTTWNYFDNLPLFLEFLRLCKNSISLINPYSQIVWSLNKKYLLELQGLGINIPQTKLFKSGEAVNLKKICEDLGWEQVVIKPCISAAAWNTYCINKITNKTNTLFSRLLKEYDMLVQVFQKNIQLRGEISLMIIEGKFSHAVLKRAKDGDFRVQDDFGGTVSLYQAKTNEILFAENVVEKIPFKPVYARVDIVLDNNNLLALSELELIEPEMWFRLFPAASKKMAIAVKSFMTT